MYIFVNMQHTYHWSVFRTNFCEYDTCTTDTLVWGSLRLTPIAIFYQYVEISMSVSTISKQTNMSHVIILNSNSISASKLIKLIPMLTVWIVIIYAYNNKQLKWSGSKLSDLELAY